MIGHVNNKRKKLNEKMNLLTWNDFKIYLTMMTAATVFLFVLLAFIVTCRFKYMFSMPLRELNEEIHNPKKMI